MPTFTLHPDEPLVDAARRIVDELITDAVGRLDDEDEVGREAAVHEARKRCKEARGVVRAIRDGIGEQAYQATNAALRDAARQLAPMRDRHAMLATFDALVGARPDAPDVGPVRKQLRLRAAESSRDRPEHLDAIADARELLVAARNRLTGWTLTGEAADCIEAGVRRTHGRAVEAMEQAAKTDEIEAFHEWRKRVKYSWYHAEVQRTTAPSELEPRAAALHRLSDALGDAHDLAVIVETVTTTPEEFGGRGVVEVLAALADETRVELERRSLGLGRRLLAEPADVYAARIRTYWTVWRDHGDEAETGEIADLWPVSDGLDDLTADHLRSLAGQVGVVGRWSMRADELRAALRAADRREP